MVPQRIPFNALDRAFLVPETDDPTGAYFPMSVACAVTLTREPSPDAFVEALCRVERRFPQMRLGYQIDAAHSRLQRVPADQLDSALAGLVRRAEGGSIGEKLSAAIRTNPAPISQPVEFALDGKILVMQMHHSFGDARFLFHLLGLVLLAYADPAAFERLPDLPPHWGLPLWKLVAQSPRQLWQIVKGIPGSFSGNSGEKEKPAPATRQPIVSGSAMGVVTKVLSPAAIESLNALRTRLSGEVKISFNTLLQALTGYRLAELGLSKSRIFSIPVDLHRYLKVPDAFYPGNLASQIRATPSPSTLSDLRATCIEIQQQVNAQLDTCTPLAMLPMSMLIGLFDRTYKRLNRDWLLEAFTTDPRFFVLTNLGNLDVHFGRLTDSVDVAEGIFFAVPLMGAPPLVLSVSTVAGQGNLTITYDPQVLHAEQVEAISAVFDPGRLVSF